MTTDPAPHADQIPDDWTITITDGGERYPFVEDENANITGLGHQDPTAFAEAIYRFELDCGMDELPEDERFDADHIVHAWVTLDVNGETLHPADEGTPGAFAVTGLWGQR